MSKTETKVLTDVATIRAAARAIKELDHSHCRVPFFRRMPYEDQCLWTQARDNLFKIITNAGYEAHCQTYRVKRTKKVAA